MIKHIVVLLFLTMCLLFLSGTIFAQVETGDVDTVVLQQAVENADTIKKSTFTVIPKKAALYSAVVPGMGQLYNKQYWKVGLVYAALGAGTGFIIFNTTQYNKWRRTYVENLYGDATVAARAKIEMDYYQKYRDMSVLLTGVGYILQVMDAIVFAHLKDFDISPDIGLRIQPAQMLNNGLGLGIAMRFK